MLCHVFVKCLHLLMVSDRDVLAAAQSEAGMADRYGQRGARQTLPVQGPSPRLHKCCQLHALEHAAAAAICILGDSVDRVPALHNSSNHTRMHMLPYRNDLWPSSC